MTIAAIKAEITIDPLTRGYAGMTDQQVVDSLLAQDRSRINPLSSAELLAWAAGGADDAQAIKSRYERIQESSTAHPSGAVRGACLAAMGLIQRDGTELDLNLPDRAALVGGLVAGGVLTVTEQAELTTLATETVSRAEELGLGVVRPGHVTLARSGA